MSAVTFYVNPFIRVVAFTQRLNSFISVLPKHGVIDPIDRGRLLYDKHRENTNIIKYVWPMLNRYFLVRSKSVNLGETCILTSHILGYRKGLHLHYFL